MRRHIQLVLFALLASACGRDPVCEDVLDNDCNHGCRCPADHYCIGYSSIVGNPGSNTCTKACTQQTQCPADTRCVEVRIGDALNSKIEGECWPDCTADKRCRGSTTCQPTKLYLGGAPLFACF